MMKKITGNRLEGMYRGIFFTLLENLAMAGTFACLGPWFLDMARGIGSGQLWWPVGGVLVCYGLRTFFSVKSYTLTMTAAYRITAGVRLRLGEKFRQLPMGFFTRRDLGALSNAVLQDAGLLDFLFSHIFVKWISSLVFPLFTAVILVLIHPGMFGLALVPLVLAVPFMVKSRAIVKARGKKRLSIIDRTDAAVLEYVQGIRVMKSYGITGLQNKKLLGLFRTLTRESIRFEALAMGYGMAFSAVIDLGFAGLLLAGAWMFGTGAVQGELVLLFLVLCFRFYSPMFDLMQYSLLTQYMTNAGRRIEKILDTPGLETPALPQVPARYNIRFFDVSFAYDKRPVLSNVSFKAKEKTFTALVGPSGSGKTTVTNLMALFWNNYRGEIRIGGIELRKMDPERVMGLFAFVFQDVYLFSDTVFNNIWTGNPSASREMVVEAARKAHCHEFILILEKGYDTLVGEGGWALSGGQKQRISIARAMLKDAPIVVMDEATTALDPVNEALIQAAVDNLVRSKTLFVIAHRLHTIVRADRILVLDRGRVTEQGTHKELMDKDGRYKSMWTAMTRESDIGQIRQRNREVAPS
jgi:ATP-binding cassette subfamily B protein